MLLIYIKVPSTYYKNKKIYYVLNNIKTLLIIIRNITYNSYINEINFENKFEVKYI